MSSERSRILVTGANGFVGKHTARALVDRGHEVIALSRSPADEDGAGVELYQMDLLSGQARNLIRSIRPDVLVHLAWYTEYGVYWHSHLNQQWLDASKRLILDCFEAGATRCVVAGTCAEYDWSAGDFREQLSPTFQPSTKYAQSKLDLSRFCQQLAEQGQSIATARLFYVYGPGEGKNRLIPQIVQRLLAGQKMHCNLDFHRRDFCHVRDIADGFAQLCHAPDSGVFNLASGVPAKVRDMAMTIGEITGRSDLLSFGGAPDLVAHEPDSLVADTTRLRQAITWKPAIDLRSGLADTVEWFSELGGLCRTAHK